ncbi:MAG TPA: hypothetical protein PKB06_07180 [Actinotalea sp.]|nr:hypothetical protein [Actinotalea sp.]
MDLNDVLRGLHHEFESRASEPVAGPIVAAARRRRVVARTGYAAVSTGLVAALVVGGLALADREQPLPPATSTIPTDTPSVTPTPSDAPAPTPTRPAFEPDLAACGGTFDDGFHDPTVDLFAFAADLRGTGGRADRVPAHRGDRRRPGR